MRYFKIIALFLTVSAILFVSAIPSFAQTSDLSGMDNDQLIQLLQSVLQKLEGSGSDAPAKETDPGTSAAAVSGGDENTPELSPEIRRFRVYLNKKMTVELLPDYFFVQPRTDEGEEDASGPFVPGKEKETGDKCETKCHDECPFSDYECVWACIANCTR